MTEDASVITVPSGWGGKGKAAFRPLYRMAAEPHLLGSSVGIAADRQVMEDNRQYEERLEVRDWPTFP
jgi:hypothetical protein